MDITSPNFIASNLATRSPLLATVEQPQSQPQPQAQAQNQGQSNGQTVTASDGTVLDSGVVNLAKAIRQKESGGDYNAIGDNGTSHGAYQWQPGNFAKDAEQFGLDPNDFSPVNQDKVAYKQIEAYKQAGYSPEQVASLWNSGKPDATGNQGVTTVNGKPLSYDTPKYVSDVMNYFNQNKLQNPGQSAQPQDLANQQIPQEQSPSVGGFLGNVVKSGANFIGNIGNAVLHPIDTVQNIGGAAVGAAQELGGQTNDNTAKFDNLKNYFINRYGSVDNMEKSLYQDPVGVLGDLSAAFGVAGGAVGALGKVGELAGAADAADVAGSVASGLGKASELTNPLTPVIKGVGALVNKSSGLVSEAVGGITGLKSATVEDIVSHPQDYTPEQIANTTRASVAQQVETALDNRATQLSETGTAYTPLKENPVPIKVEPDGLDNIIRSSLGVDVTDGVIKPTSTSELRDTTAISKLQGVYNTFKGDFLNGTMDSQKFLNLRSDLGDIAYNDSGIKNTKVAGAAEDVRNSLNSTYRSQIPNLENTDAEYSSQLKELKTLKKGFVDKEGNLTASATNKIANSLGKGKDLQLEKLEQIVPGITRKLQVLKSIEDITKESSGFLRTAAEAGGGFAAISSGNIPVMAGAFATAILTEPKYAVPLLKLFGSNKALLSAILGNLTKYTTLGVVGNQATSATLPTNVSPQEMQGNKNPTTTPQSQTSTQQTQSQQVLPYNLDELASKKNFDLTSARKAGHSDADILAFLQSQK